MPYQEVARGLRENPQRVRGALNDASQEGYLSFGRDDVTKQGGYSITAKGKARVVSGHQTVNGKHAEENKQASDEKEFAAHVMSAPIATIPAIKQNQDVTDDAMPETTVLEAVKAVNWMLLNKIENLESDIENQQNLLSDIENQQNLLASKTEQIVELEKRVDILRANNAGMLGDWNDIRRELDVATHEEALQAIAELNKAYEERTQRQLDKLGEPIGYAHVWNEGFTRFDTEEEARADIEESFAQIVGDAGESLLCAILDSANISVKWSRS